MFELKHLRMLQAIREQGSLAMAAKEIHLTQSALSHALRNLEEQVDGSLLERKSKPIRFTGAGLRLLSLADEILPKVDLAEEDLQQMARGTQGRLLLAMECHSCFDWLLPTLNDYRKEWPDIDLDIRIGMPFDAYPALKSGVVDVVVSSDPKDDPDIHFFPLFSYETLMICSKRHSLASAKRVEAKELKGETLITYPVAPSRLDFYSRFLAPARAFPKRIRTTELTMMIAQLVASGQGIAGLPAWAIHREVRDGTVAAIPLGKDGLWCKLYAAVRKEDAAQAYVKAFFETARLTSIQHLPNIVLL